MFEKIAENYLQETRETFESYKKMAEKAFAQVSDKEFFRAIDAEANSIAAITKHIGGNLRSRWTEFLTSDGEKPDRDRDREFVAENDTRASVMQIWEAGWQALFETMKNLAPESEPKILPLPERLTVRCRIRLITSGRSSFSLSIFVPPNGKL